ncbi:AraC family transcriptional regulator [Methylobacterium sp. 10]|uniref:helix-turn-helix domain-containing protein n=1 Tax=Methylobacterium sp. 10 TaxID=1101191 RepID=UPI0004B84C13|nr:AraC family transcriptional regulator [Methylobacterium sp. 10]
MLRTLVHEGDAPIAVPPAPASLHPTPTHDVRFGGPIHDPVRQARIRPDDWSDGAIVLGWRDGMAGSLRVDRLDALIIQVRLGETEGRFPRRESAEGGGRDGGQAPMLLRAGEAILHDLRQTCVLRTQKRTLQIGLDNRLLKQVAEDLSIIDADPLDELVPIFGEILADPALHNLAVSVGETLDRQDRWADVIRRQLTRAVAAHLLGTYTPLQPAPETVRGGLAPWQLRRAQDHIRADLARAIHLRAVSEACGLSISHFARAFRQSTGVAPHSWLTRERIAQAKTMMRRGDRTLADIALACGFADQSHFTRAFAKDQGTTPGRWRRRVEPDSQYA